MPTANAFAQADEQQRVMAQVVRILLKAAAERRARLGLEPGQLTVDDEPEEATREVQP